MVDKTLCWVVLDRELIQWTQTKPEGNKIDLKKVINHIALSSECSIESTGRKEFKVNTAYGSTLFTAQKEKEKEIWFDSIKRVIDIVARNMYRATILLGPLMKNSLRQKESLEKKGWLILMGKEKKWFWLRDNILRWYFFLLFFYFLFFIFYFLFFIFTFIFLFSKIRYDRSYENKNDPPSGYKGLQPLLGCSVKENINNTSFTIYTPISKFFIFFYFFLFYFYYYFIYFIVFINLKNKKKFRKNLDIEVCCQRFFFRAKRKRRLVLLYSQFDFQSWKRLFRFS